MQNDKVRQFAVVFSIITMIVMNYLSNAGAFGGRTNGEISDKYHTLITPAGYAFAIWGLIFLSLLAFAIYQGLGSQQANPRFRAIGWWVVLNALCNAIWSPLFNNEQIGIALLVILVMLASLVVIEQRLLEKQHQPAPGDRPRRNHARSNSFGCRNVAGPYSFLYLFRLGYGSHHFKRGGLPESNGF